MGEGGGSAGDGSPVLLQRRPQLPFGLSKEQLTFCMLGSLSGAPRHIRALLLRFMSTLRGLGLLSSPLELVILAQLYRRRQERKKRSGEGLPVEEDGMDDDVRQLQQFVSSNPDTARRFYTDEIMKLLWFASRVAHGWYPELQHLALSFAARMHMEYGLKRAPMQQNSAASSPASSLEGAEAAKIVQDWEALPAVARVLFYRGACVPHPPPRTPAAQHAPTASAACHLQGFAILGCGAVVPGNAAFERHNFKSLAGIAGALAKTLRRAGLGVELHPPAAGKTPKECVFIAGGHCHGPALGTVFRHCSLCQVGWRAAIE